MLDKCGFVDWQRLRVQENADEIPAGSMPRCVDIICRNEVVETAKAGDKIIITGKNCCESLKTSFVLNLLNVLFLIRYGGSDSRLISIFQSWRKHYIDTQ